MLKIRDVTHSFDGHQVLKGITLDVSLGEIVCLLGESGCGKTTLLRVIAGLEEPDTGTLLVNGSSIVDVPVHERGFGLMFQEYALFPHMNVASNVMFGLKMRRFSREEQERRMLDVLGLVGLAGFEERNVSQLSGGERQRVALARSLAPNPRLLMLDEPLGALDANLRGRLAIELRTIIKRVGLTAIYVTHDQQEAFAIADRVAVMNAGLIEQIGTPEAVYRRPTTLFTAKFLGLNNIIPVEWFEYGTARTPIGDLPCNPVTVRNQQPEAVLVHPDDIKVGDENSPGMVRGKVVEHIFLGGIYRLQVEHEAGVVFHFSLSPRDGYIPRLGETVTLNFTEEATIPLY